MALLDRIAKPFRAKRKEKKRKERKKSSPSPVQHTSSSASRVFLTNSGTPVEMSNASINSDNKQGPSSVLLSNGLFSKEETSY